MEIWPYRLTYPSNEHEVKTEGSGHYPQKKVTIVRLKVRTSESTQLVETIRVSAQVIDGRVLSRALSDILNLRKFLRGRHIATHLAGALYDDEFKYHRICFRGRFYKAELNWGVPIWKEYIYPEIIYSAK